ncbi:MAG: LysE family translocator [Robiginitomaculum sp.]|nr:LysE family translocator [Robiginitomaculum sp.]
MIDPQSLILFAGACLVLAMIPGPDNLFISAQAISHGKKAGFAAAFGILAGLVFWALAAVFGLTAMISSMPAVLIIIQIAGAGYLLFLAFDLWRNTGQQANISLPSEKIFWRGFTTNILNPKIGLYYLAFLPQFIAPDGLAIWLQMLILVAIFNIVGGVVMLSVAQIVGSAQHSISGKPSTKKWLSRFGSIILVGIAVRLVWQLLGT